jgi:protein-S-isoprenylcysteine O-methyltransferase Ste14
MGWFGSDTISVAVSNAANGKATASVDVPIPFWEIVLIAAIVAIIIYACISCTREHLRTKWDNAIKAQVAKSTLELA